MPCLPRSKQERISWSNKPSTNVYLTILQNSSYSWLAAILCSCFIRILAGWGWVSDGRWIMSADSKWNFRRQYLRRTPPLFFFSLADSGSEASCHNMRNYRKKTDTVIDLRILTMFKKIYVIWKFSSSNFETRTATKRMMQPGLMCIHIK